MPSESRWKAFIPRTAMGLAGLVFCMGIASAFTGTVLYAYYEARLNKTEKAVERLTTDFTDQLEAAKAIIQAEAESARDQVHDQLDELQKFAPSGETLSSLLAKAAPSVWFVSTLDEAGQPSVGSAFVVFADAEKSYLLTSYTTIRAATQSPAPDVLVTKASESLNATVFTWDPSVDLALLSIDKPNQPALEWAAESDDVAVGDRVFVVSGLGSAGGAVVQGVVADVSAQGFQHDAPVGSAFQGGPLLDADGKVVGVASRTYAPLGFATQAVFFAPPIRSACTAVLRCPDGAAQPG